MQITFFLLKKKTAATIYVRYSHGTYLDQGKRKGRELKRSTGYNACDIAQAFSYLLSTNSLSISLSNICRKLCEFLENFLYFLKWLRSFTEHH